MAIRDSDQASEASGINFSTNKMLSFFYLGIYAGLGMSTFCPSSSFIFTDLFVFWHQLLL
jgi:hypothetical protein